MIIPIGASSFKEAMKMGVEVYHHLKVGWLSHYRMDTLVSEIIHSFGLITDQVFLFRL